MNRTSETENENNRACPYCHDFHGGRHDCRDGLVNSARNALAYLIVDLPKLPIAKLAELRDYLIEIDVSDYVIHDDIDTVLRYVGLKDHAIDTLITELQNIRDDECDEPGAEVVSPYGAGN